MRELRLPVGFAVSLLLLLMTASGSALAQRRFEYNGKGTIEAYNKATLYFNKGTQLSETGNHLGAVVQFRKAVSVWPYDADAYYGLGNALAKMGERDEAEKAYYKAVKLDPKASSGWSALGEMYEKEGDLASTEKCYRKSVEISPEEWVSNRDLASVLLERGKYSEARTLIEKAKKLPGADAALIDRILEQCNREKPAKKKK
ncbi:MAG: tetratricopeptide repeat protein [Candidatus Obscuribacterales bacterium]|nr:tetratricopeptide repeat protein [Candidatus Obscuribacterales bacterium]